MAAQLAGYDSQSLQDLPDDAVANSFGCGNPLAFAGVQPGQTVLDLGSGAGIDLLIAAEKVGPTGRVIGVDMTDEMLQRARENIAASGHTNIEVRQGIIEELPVDTASVDWVISNCVINLSPEKDRVFAEIARVLKPGGRISISDIVANDLPSWVKKSAALYASCVAGAVSEREYLAGLRAAGLQDVEVSERLVYDRTQLKGFLRSDEAGEITGSACCVGKVARRAAEPFLGQVEGKIWSAKVLGQKPADA